MKCSRRRTAILALAAWIGCAASTVSTRSAHAVLGDCSQPLSGGSAPVATDCLYILNVAIGLQTCLPACICAPSGALPTVAGDALACLLVATGGTFVLDCPCGVTTTLTPPTSTTVPPTTTSTLSSPSSSTTTTTLAVGTGCPDTLDITSFGGTGGECDGDADCPAGRCDLGLSRCVTATELDFGWTGIGHDMDTNDGWRLRARLACGGEAPCGECALTGIEPDHGACRCSNDNRAHCDEPFVADADDCGGAECRCYAGPPLPTSVGSLPACILDRLAADVSGTIDVDTGDLAITLSLRALFFLGEDVFIPCAYCEGDTVAGDGVRDGTCVHGDDEGLSCDVDALNTSFPAPGGGGTSLDCHPFSGRNVSGSGLVHDLVLTTAASSLGSDVDCSVLGIPYACHCGICAAHCATNDDCADGALGSLCSQGVCSPKSSTPCRSDGECIAAGFDTCAGYALLDPRPNGCAGEGTCEPAAGGDGVCTDGPTDEFCDGVLRADGSGLLPCVAVSDDCASYGDWVGQCTLSKARECFPTTIEATGAAHPDAPIGAGIYCSPRTSSAGTSAVWGLPGPARLVSQMRTRKLCGGPDGTAYVAGSGCPLPPGPAAAPAAD